MKNAPNQANPSPTPKALIHNAFLDLFCVKYSLKILHADPVFTSPFRDFRCDFSMAADRR
jgi:hypothetical protein